MTFAQAYVLMAVYWIRALRHSSDDEVFSIRRRFSLWRVHSVRVAVTQQDSIAITSRHLPMLSTQQPVPRGQLARQLQAADRRELEIENPAGALLDLSTIAGASTDTSKFRCARLQHRN